MFNNSMEIEKNQDSEYNLNFQKSQEYQNNETSLKSINKMDIENPEQKNIIEQLQDKVNNPKTKSDNDIIRFEEMKQMKISFANQQQQLIDKAQEYLAQIEREKKKQIKKILDQQKQRELKQQQQKNSDKSLIEQLMSKSTEVYGQLDICYVIDSTISMEPYIQQARKCVRESLKIIKFQTNRDTNVSAVCYYDIEQKPKTGFYHQLDFTKDPQVLESFLDQIKTAGGRDPPEDVKGAFDQMLSNIKWKNKFRLAILITDAPCHGLKYHEASITDYHKNSDITETLHNIVKNGIILIGFNLNRHTTQMYNEFEKVYKEIQKQDQFFMIDVQGQQVDTLAEQMARTLGEVSELATEVKYTGAKSAKAQQDRPKNNDIAMEALCKQGNFYNFEQQENVKVVDENFKVLKVEIVDKIFEENILTINNIGKSQDHYKITDEGMWQCIRTDQPFAFGEMKDVFLMKKKNAMKDELFVIKTPIGSQPYKTQNDAINTCRSHLICQKLVKKFRDQIEKAKEETNQNLFVPAVIYNDILILEETNDRFWIAEPFFKGEVVKYNNNYGYINPTFAPLNKFAQAFSYYTFFISGGKYLVNNVQGIDNNFTDPAFNTNAGDFDDKDLGLEGQQMFLVSFELKNQLASDYLKILDIQFEIKDGNK